MNACAGIKRSHLQKVGKSYTEHGKGALTLAWRAAKIAVALTIHAVLPNVLQDYGSKNIVDLYYIVRGD